MKIGIFYYSSIYERTGAGKVVRSMAEAQSLFKENGVDEVCIYSLTPPYSGIESGESRRENGGIRLTKRLKNIFKEISQKTYLGSCICIKMQWVKHGVMAVNAYEKESMQDEDILIFHEVFSCHAYLALCKRRGISPKKYILVLHTNGEVWKMIRIYFPKICNRKFDQWLENFSDSCMEGASKIVFVSETSKLHFQSLYPGYAWKAETIYNGISDCLLSDTGRDCPNLSLVTVGTINKRKNQIAIIEAISGIEDHGITLTVVGGGDELENCRTRTKELGIMQQVLFLGPRDDVAEILNKCNVFIMSSLDEGLPISGIEALRSGMPVILTDVGGNRELVSDNGLLVRPDMVEIRNAIKYMNEHRIEMAAMGKQSRLLYERKFSMGSMIRAYCSLLKEI